MAITQTWSTSITDNIKVKTNGWKLQLQLVAIRLLTFSAVAPLPDDIYEMLFAGLLREKAVEMVQCETVDLEVPAHSEFVLEGYVDPAESSY